MATSTPTKNREPLRKATKKGIHNLKDPHYLAIKLPAFSNTKHIGNGWNTRIFQSRCHVDAHALETWRLKRHHLQIIFLGKAMVFSTSM
jgi:hypothetical protein